MEVIKAPYRLATSQAAKRMYVGTFLLVSTSLVLLSFAVIAYPVFYYHYIPEKVTSIPVHLQYNAGNDPYGIVPVSPDLMLEQAYDVSVHLTLPRSPANLARGNFMVTLYVLRSVPENPALTVSTSAPAPMDLYPQVSQDDVIFSSRRPVLIPYTDPLVTMASRVLFLLYHVVFARAAETVTLSVPMGELIEFSAVRPLSILVDVEAGQTLQVYSTTLTLVARLTGLRWFMYNHRILAFVLGTAGFWLAELVFMALAWGLLAWVLSGREDRTESKSHGSGSGGGMYERMRQGDVIKYEPDVIEKSEFDDDDVDIKEETPELESEEETLDRLPRHAGDADDEGDSDDGHKAAGSGTGSHHKESGQLRRRVSRGGHA
ncbi:putative adipose-regulatory protein-domain-containing protein [Nemania sp. FL0916]|nr:putative adipose-regulatory protein-domain-containing protein [Nemania sp. FL0916]